MKVKLLLIFTIILSTSIIAQENIFNKTYKNSNPNIEFGVGYLLNPSDADYGLSYQLVSRNILLNKKLGFMYTLEPNTDNNSDVFGINYRFSKDLSLQLGSGLFYNSFFDSNDGARKKISIAYHPEYMPLTVAAGYSIDMGPSIGINYRIFFNDKNKSDLTKLSENTKPNILTNKKENIIAQDNVFNKTYKNISPNIEFGVGYLLSPSDADYGIRYQIASRNILLNNKLGFMYTLEPNTENNSDVFGINYRFSKDLSLQLGSGLFYNSFFDSNDGARKKISIAYHPEYMPLTVTAGYSIDMGPSIGINYRIFFNSKKKKTKSDLTKISNNTSTNIVTTKKENIIEKTIDKPKSNIAKKEAPSVDRNKSKESTINTKNEQNIISNQTLNEKMMTNKVNALDSVRKPVKQKIVKKEINKIKKPTVDTDKLSKESKVLFSLNTYEISTLEKNNLKKLSKYLKENPKSTLIIYGSTDKSGSEEYNLSLSEKRANSSKNYLLELGVNSNQLKTIALGESKSQNANSETEKAQARSSMFEIVIEK